MQIKPKRTETQRTEITYLINSHEYLSNTDCADPRNCVQASHWQGWYETDATTWAELVDTAAGDDAPAVRIAKRERVMVETIEVMTHKRDEDYRGEQIEAGGWMPGQGY